MPRGRGRGGRSGRGRFGKSDSEPSLTIGESKAKKVLIKNQVHSVSFF